MLAVVEKFVSINGEGAHAGELAVFLRFRGCNLRCTYCDTCYANEKDTPVEWMTVQSLTDWVKETGIRLVTLTGGEPLLQKELPELIAALSAAGCRVEIETNGSLPLTDLASMERRPVFTMDYKLPGSGMETKMCRDNFQWLGEHDTVKFVAGSMDDLERAKEMIEAYGLIGRCHLYLSPVFGKIEPAKMVSWMTGHRLNGVRLQLQMHKIIWDPAQRGV